MLDRLLLAQWPPFGAVQEFCAELADTRDQPTEVTADQRAAHLVLLTTAFFLPLLMMFVFPPAITFFSRVKAIAAVSSQIREDERVLSDLKEGMKRDFLFSLLQ